MPAESDTPEPPRRVVVRRSGELLTGSRPGDRRLHLRRPETVQIPIRARASRRAPWPPAAVFVAGFVALILAGTLILTLPLSSAVGEWTPPLEALFTATSAVCVTGLVVVDTGTYWSGFGQAVILLLIQLGGLGFMTSSTLLLLLLRRQATLRERILLREALGASGLGAALHLARRIVTFTVAAEMLGALALALGFWAELGDARALWWGLFHAVSAFNNAGFDLTGGYRSLTPFSGNVAILLAVAALLIVGSISYTAVEDLARCRRRLARLTLDTKLVLVTSAGLILLGTLGLLFTEWGNPATLGGLAPGPRLLNGFFMGVTPRTAGFNSVEVGALTENGLLVLMALMFVGGASGSTAGGIKVQTFSLLLFAMLSTVRGTLDVEVFGRRVPVPYIYRALTVALLSLATVFLVSFLLSIAEPFGLLRVLFEAFSAFGTVGLSTGITPETTPIGRIILIAAMFAGRLGPLTLVLALAARERAQTHRLPEEAVKIG